MTDKQILKIKVSHPDPEIEKRGVEIVKNLVQNLSKILGEKVEMIEIIKEEDHHGRKNIK